MQVTPHRYYNKHNNNEKLAIFQEFPKCGTETKWANAVGKMAPVACWRQGCRKPAVSEKVLCCAEELSLAPFSVTLWTVARQAPLSMGFSRQAYWSELPCPPPGDLRDPGIKPRSPALQADSLPS